MRLLQCEPVSTCIYQYSSFYEEHLFLKSLHALKNTLHQIFVYCSGSYQVCREFILVLYWVAALIVNSSKTPLRASVVTH